MSSCFYVGERRQLWLNDLCAAKVQIYFGLSKKNALLRAFFSLELRGLKAGIPEYDSEAMDKDTRAAHARMRTKCTR